VFSYTQPREAILDYDRWYLKRKGEWQATAISEGKRHGKTVIAHFEGVDDRDEAAAFINCEIAIERDALPEAEDGSYYWADLEGLRVVHRDGTELGRVAYLMETGANDVLVTEGERERLIPFVADKVILDVDLDEGVISVDWEWD
jgi:16S rRNA processing protein RimM